LQVSAGWGGGLGPVAAAAFPAAALFPLGGEGSGSCGGWVRSPPRPSGAERGAGCSLAGGNGCSARACCWLAGSGPVILLETV